MLNVRLWVAISWTIMVRYHLLIGIKHRQLLVNITESDRTAFHVSLGLTSLGFYETFIVLLFDLSTLLFPPQCPVSIRIYLIKWDTNLGNRSVRQHNFIYLLASCKHHKALIAVSDTHKEVRLNNIGVNGRSRGCCLVCLSDLQHPYQVNECNFTWNCVMSLVSITPKIITFWQSMLMHCRIYRI